MSKQDFLDAVFHTSTLLKSISQIGHQSHASFFVNCHNYSVANELPNLKVFTLQPGNSESVNHFNVTLVYRDKTELN